MATANASDHFANPFLVCEVCGARVWYKDDFLNRPCGHLADYKNLCPSWGPVDGCQCQAHLGYVPHPAKV